MLPSFWSSYRLICDQADTRKLFSAPANLFAFSALLLRSGTLWDWRTLPRACAAGEMIQA